MRSDIPIIKYEPRPLSRPTAARTGQRRCGTRRCASRPAARSRRASLRRTTPETHGKRTSIRRFGLARNFGDGSPAALRQNRRRDRQVRRIAPFRPPLPPMQRRLRTGEPRHGNLQSEYMRLHTRSAPRRPSAPAGPDNCLRHPFPTRLPRRSPFPSALPEKKLRAGTFDEGVTPRLPPEHAGWRRSGPDSKPAELPVRTVMTGPYAPSRTATTGRNHRTHPPRCTFRTDSGNGNELPPSAPAGPQASGIRAQTAFSEKTSISTTATSGTAGNRPAPENPIPGTQTSETHQTRNDPHDVRVVSLRQWEQADLNR